jgi:reactive chlorine resistance protein C
MSMAAFIERMKSTQRVGITLEDIGAIVLRYGLAMILVWIGALKFTAYEAEGIRGLVANSPLMAWGYDLMSTQGYAMLIGGVEIVLGVLIATRPFAPKVSAIGSLGAIPMFVITLSFLLTTPGVWQEGYGFPSLSGGGQFLVKDVILLGAALWTAGEALRAVHRHA